jgi:hypothetical protein
LYLTVHGKTVFAVPVVLRNIAIRNTLRLTSKPHYHTIDTKGKPRKLAVKPF